MSEIPKGNPQFVGQADARNLRAAEIAKPVDVTLSPEQQQVADVMKQSGQVLEKNILDASEKAGEQLQKLQGRALVNAGLKQMGYGAWESIKSEFKWGIGGALIGGVAGAAKASATLGSDFISIGAIMGASQGGGLGALVGYETAGLRYNKKVAPDRNLPKTEWYDWVAGNLSMVGLSALARGKVRGTAGSVMATAASLFTNPISIGGLRNVATGLWQMRKG